MNNSRRDWLGMDSAGRMVLAPGWVRSLCTVPLLSAFGIAALIPLEGYTAFVIADYPISVPLATWVGLVYLSLLRIAVTGRFALDSVGKAAAFVLAAGALSAVGVVSHAGSFTQYTESLVYVFLFPVGLLLLTQQELDAAELNRGLWLMTGVAAAVSLIAILQAATHLGILDLNLTFSLTNPMVGEQRQVAFGAGGIYLRPTGPFGEPSWLAHYLSVTALMGLILLRRTTRKLLVGVLVLVQAAAIALSMSFGAFLALAGALVLAFPWTRHRLRLLCISAVVGAVLGVGAFLAAPNAVKMLATDVSARIELEVESVRDFAVEPSHSKLVSSSAVLRGGSSWYALTLWLHDPISLITGWGVGNIGTAFTTVLKHRQEYAGVGWCNLLAEQGVVGMLAFAFLMWAIMRYLLRRRTTWHDSRGRGECALLIAVVVFFILAGFTGGLGFERSMRFWGLLVPVYVMARARAVASDGKET